MSIGIEAINVYAGQMHVNVRDLFEYRQLDLARFDNLMMDKKSITLPCEDPVTNAVNAAKPLLDKLSAEEKNSIEAIITASESGLDFGKSLSTYIHGHLGLSRHCRLFEVKQACYAGTAALQMAVNLIAADVSPNAKVLVITTDVARAQARMTYAEPSQGVAAVAMLVGDDASVLEFDLGAYGLYGFDIMDTCRPQPELETGDADLSLLTYMEGAEEAYAHYLTKLPTTNYNQTFQFLVHHTPYAGLVKATHKRMNKKYGLKDDVAIEEDFVRRAKPSLLFSTQVGNVYSGSTYLALAGLLTSYSDSTPARVGIYSYGSGCSSEFYSGVIYPEGAAKVKAMNIQAHLDNRFTLSMERYDEITDLNIKCLFGLQNFEVDFKPFQDIYNDQFKGKNLLVLKSIKDFKREYQWS